MLQVDASYGRENGRRLHFGCLGMEVYYRETKTRCRAFSREMEREQPAKRRGRRKQGWVRKREAGVVGWWRGLKGGEGEQHSETPGLLFWFRLENYPHPNTAQIIDHKPTSGA